MVRRESADSGAETLTYISDDDHADPAPELFSGLGGKFGGLEERQAPLNVMEFRRGQTEPLRRELRRSEILNECRNMMRRFRVFERGARGSQPELRGGILQPRDLRTMDESFAHSHHPTFLARQYCMVINLKPVRAIILPGKVLLFPRVGADGELLIIMNKLRAPSMEDPTFSLPFEFQALEAFLQTTVMFLQKEEQGLQRSLRDAKEFMQKKANRFKHAEFFQRLQAVRDTLNVVKAEAKGVRKALSDLLDEEEDLALLAWPFHYRPNIMMPRADPGTAPVALSATPAGDRSGAEVDGGQRRVKRGLERASSARHLLGEPERPDRLWHHLPLIGGVGKSVQHHRHQHQHQHGHPGAAPALPLHLSKTEGAGESPGRQSSRTRTVAVVLQEDAEADAAEQMLEAYLAEVEASIRSLGHLSDEVGNVEHEQAMEMSASRNLLLKTDLFISVTLMFVAAGSTVFGAFGMNLNSHVWETPGAFKKTVWITCMGIFLMTLATFGALQVYLRS